ncbi:sulfotransferase [Shewanella sp. MEBiC00475]|uniref:sulfotransferase n=1 Tax=Shewanella sp. MEBiC00475 TaxID=2575361 RepID=UPI0010C12B09|nr:sulfotransferase [Shewanella sp. MEBiC00475]
MFSYFITTSIDDVVSIATPSIGILDKPELAIQGRVVVKGNITSISAINLLGEELTAAIEYKLAPKLHQQLTLTPQQGVYRFNINVEQADLVEDAHFSIVAEVESQNSKLDKVILLEGVIQPVTLPQRVVLVVGSPRSGTSALGKACRKALRSTAHGESHVVEGVNRMLTTADAFFQQSKTASIAGNLVNAIPKTVIIAQQLTSLRQIYRLYYGDEVLLDKTPGIPMLDSLPLAMMAWPHAKVIFCKRRAMENVQSRIIKFPKVAFEQHIKQWRQSFVAWRNSKQKINKLLKHNQWFIEVDQFDMATAPSSVVERVANLLAFIPREKKVFLKQLASDDRPEQTSAIQTKTKSLDEFGWSEAHIALFKEVCTKEMALQHYSYDQSYYLTVTDDEVEQSV